MGTYQEHALESASAVELGVALYDGSSGFSSPRARPWTWETWWAAGFSLERLS
jgi:hypothetical protein